jgi:hypothetical protein
MSASYHLTASARVLFPVAELDSFWVVGYGTRYCDAWHARKRAAMWCEVDWSMSIEHDGS